MLVILIVRILRAAGSTASLKACLRAKIEETLAIFFGRLTKWALLTVTGHWLFKHLRRRYHSFAAVLASAIIAVGLTLQGTLQNFSAGVMLLIFRPFKVGDLLMSAASSTVQEIDLFVTHVLPG